MFICFFLILVTWNGVLGTEDICNTVSYRACPKSEESRYFPKTEEDIDRQCPTIAQFLECLKDYAEKCGHENVHLPFSEDRYPSMKSLLEEICQKDSQLHLRIVKNIGCLSELMGNSRIECREYSQNKSVVLMQYIQDKETEGNYDESIYNPELWIPFQCVTESLYISCFASETSRRCGSNAQNLVLELIHRSGSIKDACPSTDGDQINELIRILDLEIEDERFLKEIINKE